MKRSSSRASVRLLAGLLGIAVAALSGCALPQAQPDLTRFYVLAAAPAKTPAAPAEKRWQLGLRPVEAPPYLHNRAMVVRLGANEVRFAEESRWAEPIEAGVARVLRETLEARADVERVVPVTANAETPRDCDVLVRLQRCEGARDAGAARFVATVEIYALGDRPARVARETVSVEIPGWDGRDFADLARKLSAAVDQLADKTVALLPAKS
jgi:uncharacterized protein